MRSLLLADEFFLLGHDENTGKTVVRESFLEAGLAGAVLAELALAGRTDTKAGRIVVVDRHAVSDDLTDTLLADLLRERESHAARVWVDHLREGMRGRVAGRLVAAGVVTPVVGRGLTLRRPTLRYQATDPIVGSGPRVRLRYVMKSGRAPDLATATLVTLVRAVNLDDLLVLDLTRQQIRDWAAAALRLLPPALLDVVRAVAAVVETLIYTGDRR